MEFDMKQLFKITLRNDYAFKRVFGTEENKDVLQDLLECILDSNMFFNYWKIDIYMVISLIKIMLKIYKIRRVLRAEP